MKRVRSFQHCSYEAINVWTWVVLCFQKKNLSSYSTIWFYICHFATYSLQNSHITTEGKRLIKTVLCSDKDTKYFKSKLLMAVKFELRTPQAFLFLWYRSLLFQWLFAAINLCLRRNLDWVNGNLTTVTGRWWKLEVGSDSSPEAFTSDLSEHT